MLQKAGLGAAETESISDKYTNLRTVLLARLKNDPFLNDYLLLLNALQAAECVQAVCGRDSLASIIFVHLSYKIMAEAIGRVQMEFFDTEPHKALRDLAFAKMPGGGEGNWYQRLPFAHETNLFNLISKWGSERVYILTDVSELNAELLKIVTPICPRIQTPASLPFEESHMMLSDENCEYYAIQFRQASRTSTSELRHLQYILLTIEIAEKVFLCSDLFGQSLCQQILAAALMVFVNNNMKKLESLEFNNLSMQYPNFRTARNDFAHAICLEDIIGNPVYTWQQYLQPCLNDFKDAVQLQLDTFLPQALSADPEEHKYPSQAEVTSDSETHIHINTCDATPMSAPPAHKPKKKKASKVNAKLQKLIDIIEASTYSNSSFKESMLSFFKCKSALINNEIVIYLLQACIINGEPVLIDNLLSNLHHIISGSVVCVINAPLKAKLVTITPSANTTFAKDPEIKFAATYSPYFLEKNNDKSIGWNYVFGLRKFKQLPTFTNMYLLATAMMIGNDTKFNGLLARLIKMGANPNVSLLSDLGHTQPILNIALMMGIEIAETLLAGGANPNYPDQNGNFPFFSTCECGLVDSAKLLLHYKTDIYSRTNIAFSSNLIGHIFFNPFLNDITAKTFICLIIQEATKTKGYSALTRMLQCKTEIFNANGFKTSGPFAKVMNYYKKIIPQERKQTIGLLIVVMAMLEDQNITLHKLLLLDSIPILSNYLSTMTNRQVIDAFKIQICDMDVFKFAATYNNSILSSPLNDFVPRFLRLELSKSIILETPSSQLYPVDLGRFPSPLQDINFLFVNISCYIGGQLHVVSPPRNSAHKDVVIEATLKYLFEDIYIRAISFVYERPVIAQVKKVMPGILFQLAAAAWPKPPDTNKLATTQVKVLCEDVNIIAEYLGMDSFVERLLNETVPEQGAIKD